MSTTDNDDSDQILIMLFRIKCNDYPDAYLCNAHGAYQDNNTVYVWPKEVGFDPA